MEAFESFVAIALESEGFVVSGAVKFPVTRQVRKPQRVEVQTHGFEVDLVAANAERLVLASVKSFFGSRGVVAEHVTGASADANARLYALLNDEDVRSQVLARACERYGYRLEQVEARLYVGRFAAPTKGVDEQRIRDWAAETKIGGGPVKVIGSSEVVSNVRAVAAHKQYRDNAVLVTMKVLEAAGQLTVELPDDSEQ